MRAVNQIISYDLPFVFAAFVPVVLAGSLQMSAIVAAQQGAWLGFVPKWFVVYPVIGQLAFVAFLVATLAAENRVPFDILEAESELVAGFRVEYSGMKFALIQLGEYAHMIGTSFLAALLFLGGWLGPRHGRDLQESAAAADHRALSDGEARLSRPLPRPPRADLRSPDGRGELHRVPALRVHLSAHCHQGRDAQGREAQLRQELHARALCLRVLRALRAGVSHRRHHHDEVVRPRDGRPARAAARQGPAARAGPAVRSVVGDRQPAPRHAGPAQGRQSSRARAGARVRRPKSARPSSAGARRSRSDGKIRMTETLGCWVAAAVRGAASLAVVLTPNLFHAVLWLAAALVATGGVFLLLDSPFLFGVQLLLYAGGVVTIVVFAIMLTERLVGESIRQTSRLVFNGAVLAAAVFVGILGFLLH